MDRSNAGLKALLVGNWVRTHLRVETSVISPREEELSPHVMGISPWATLPTDICEAGRPSLVVMLAQWQYTIVEKYVGMSGCSRG